MWLWKPADLSPKGLLHLTGSGSHIQVGEHGSNFVRRWLFLVARLGIDPLPKPRFGFIQTLHEFLEGWTSLRPIPAVNKSTVREPRCLVHPLPHHPTLSKIPSASAEKRSGQGPFFANKPTLWETAFGTPPHQHPTTSSHLQNGRPCLVLPPPAPPNNFFLPSPKSSVFHEGSAALRGGVQPSHAEPRHRALPPGAALETLRRGGSARCPFGSGDKSSLLVCLVSLVVGLVSLVGLVWLVCFVWIPGLPGGSIIASGPFIFQKGHPRSSECFRKEGLWFC